ncbi:MAG: T9SS C-terminal target domain-containing protein [Bacteroidetes bacterium]|nr:MAG: T9SS C-terminal target domain-containing protein [Bacteroidota bacterium]
MQKKLLLSLTMILFATVFSVAQITTVGIIGTATPNGWDSDTDLMQDPNNPDLWTISGIFLTTGEAKFRANDDWAINWGATDFPTGIGEQDGPNIPVYGGPFDITFNSATGEYTFTSTAPTFGSIGLIGTATPNGWDSDTNMVQMPGVPWVWTLNIDLVDGEAKFRADDDWANSWGSTDFPTGVGVPGGENIPVTGGNYNVTFNTASFEYSFELQTPVYSTIGLIGSATPNGWDEDTDLEQNPNNPELWSANMTLVDGEAKFRAENDWAVNWGGADFPTGIGVQDGPNIPVVGGEYNVKFNSTTGEYSFDPPIAIFSTIGIIGSGTGLGWDSDINMVQDPAQADHWTIQITLTDGEIKFRAEDDWTINWGDDGFPTGTGTQDGPNIPVFAGTWQIDFNATTGVYSFTPVTVGIIGTALANGWDSDEDMDCSTTVGNLWTTTKTLMDGEAKFRQDDAWTINWGAADWPAGIGVQDGPNIPITAGTYDIMLNTATGEYAFTDANGTTEVLNPGAVNVFPNPTASTLNIAIQNEGLQRDLTVYVMDATGKILETKQFDVASTFNLDVSGLNNGIYILQISNNQYVVGKRFTIAR